MIKSRMNDNCLSHQDQAKRSCMCTRVSSYVNFRRFVWLGLEGIGLTRNLASQLCFFILHV